MIKKKEGSILVFTLIVMSMILVTALTLSTTTVIERKASSITRSSAAAIQGADTGLEYILREFRDYNGDQYYDDFTDSLTSNNGKYPYKATDFDCDDGDSGDLIIAYVSPEQIVRVKAQKKDINAVTGEITYEDVECDEHVPLHEVASFKSIGEDNIASRALRIDMGRAVERGIIAFWDFEDYQNKRDIEDLEYSATDAAQDKSINGNTAYLCHDDRDTPTRCKRGAKRMHPGGPSDTDYNDHVSWYGTELNEDGDPIDNSDVGKGIAESNLGDDQYWAMEFSIKNNDGDAEDNPNEYLRVLDDDSLDFEENDFSVSLWVRPTTEGKTKFIQKGFAGGRHFAIYRENQSLSVSISDNAPASTPATQYDKLTDVGTGTWQHIVVAFDRDDDVIVYKNGNLETVEDISSENASLSNNHPLIIGRDQSETGGNFFVGQMDDIRIYDRVLHQEEVSALCKLGDGNGAPSCS